MRAVIQRVTEASVSIDKTIAGAIDRGLLVLLGVDRGDTADIADKLLHKILHYRVFADANGKMNLNVREVAGGLLVVSQFTLSADTRKGLRPSFTSAASPDQAETLYDYFLMQAETLYPGVQSGRFGADMAVALVNDGPVTFILDAN